MPFWADAAGFCFAIVNHPTASAIAAFIIDIALIIFANADAGLDVTPDSGTALWPGGPHARYALSAGFAPADWIGAQLELTGVEDVAGNVSGSLDTEPIQ